MNLFRRCRTDIIHILKHATKERNGVNTFNLLQSTDKLSNFEIAESKLHASKMVLKILKEHIWHERIPKDILHVSKYYLAQSQTYCLTNATLWMKKEKDEI